MNAKKRNYSLFKNTSRGWGKSFHYLNCIYFLCLIFCLSNMYSFFSTNEHNVIFTAYLYICTHFHFFNNYLLHSGTIRCFIYPNYSKLQVFGSKLNSTEQVTFWVQFCNYTIHPKQAAYTFLILLVTLINTYNTLT